MGGGVMAAGRLTDRVTFQRATVGDDGYGNTVNGWSDYLTVWADITDAPGREALAAGRLEASRSALMRVRRSAGSLMLTEVDRVRARGRLWNIRSIGEAAKNRAMLEIVIEVAVAS